jgi:hypothetical protein
MKQYAQQHAHPPGPTPGAQMSATPKPGIGQQLVGAGESLLKANPLVMMTPDFLLPKQLRGSMVGDIYNKAAAPFENATAATDPAWMRRAGDISRHARQMGNIVTNMGPMAMGDAPFPETELPTVKGAVKTVVDKLAGVEPAIREAEVARTTQIAHQSEQFETDLANARQAQEAVRSENISKYRETAQHLAETNDKLAADYSKALDEYQDAVNKAASEHADAADRAARFNAEQKMQAMQREIAGREIGNMQPKLQQHLLGVRNNIDHTLDMRWDATRQLVKGQTADVQNVANGVANGVKKVDAVHTEDFKKLYNGAFGDANWSNLTWQDMQHAYTSLGKTLANGGLTYDVFDGLHTVQNEIGQEMENMLTRAGGGQQAVQQFRVLKADYSEYMTDWENVNKRMNYGGSPLAHGLRNVDAPNVTKVFESPAGKRAIALLEKYRMYGANPELAQQYRDLVESYDDMPKGGRTMAVPKPKVVKPPEAPAPKVMTQAAYKPLPALPTRPLEPPPVDIEGIRNQMLQQFKRKAGVRIGTGAAVGAGLGASGMTAWLLHHLYGQ